MILNSIDRQNTAVLSMDMQAGIVSTYLGDRTELLERAGAVLNGARQAQLGVVHVRVGFRIGMPEVSSRNQLFAGIKQSPQHQKLFAGARGEIHSAVAPLNDEVVITKSRVNAFAGTDLEQVLRAREVDTLIMFGIATSGVVLSTMLHASDADYRLVVISDCCADLDAEVHTCLIEKLFPRRAQVLTASEFLQRLNGA